MGNSNGTKRIYWGRILLSAILAAVIAMGIVYVILWSIGQNPDIVEQVCPDDDVNCPDADTSGNIMEDLVAGIGAAIVCTIVWFLACLVKLAIWAILVYIPLSALIAVLIIRRWVEHRRTLHIVLTVILSFPVAFAILWLISKLSN